MCKLKSGIILKDRVFIPDYNSHTDMLKELEIEDTRKNAENIFVRAELTPKDGDIFSDLDSWHFKVDQDILPEWFVFEYDKERMKEEVKLWANKHIHIDNNYLSVCTGSHYAKNSNVKAYDNSNVKAYYNSNVKAYGSSNVEAYDNSNVEAYDNSMVILSKYSQSEKKNISLYGNAILKDCKTKIIYQCGDWKLVNVKEMEAQ